MLFSDDHFHARAQVFAEFVKVCVAQGDAALGPICIVIHYDIVVGPGAVNADAAADLRRGWNQSPGFSLPEFLAAFGIRVIEQKPFVPFGMRADTQDYR